MKNLNSMGVKCKIGVLADDLTGASDVGVQFRKAGLNVTVLIQREMVLEALVRSEVVVVDTESRHLDADQAYRVSRENASLFTQHGIRSLYKKVDSTLRGNIGAEIDGVMDATGVRLCAFAPAFPINGRTTLGGFQLVDGVPLEKTGAGRDILSPVQLSHVPSIIAIQSKRKVTSVFLDRIRRGEAALAKHLTEVTGQGKEIIVMDAERQDDLRLVARALSLSGLSYIAAGSAGLAAELPEAIGAVGELRREGVVRRGRGILVVVGSATSISTEQVRVASQDSSVSLVQLEVKRHLPDCIDRKYLEEVIAIVVAQLSKGHDVLVSVARADRQIGKFEESELILQLLAQIARTAVLSDSVHGLVLTGGDTAVAVFQALGAIGLDVYEEVLPGIPLGCIIGGEANGMSVVTKAGGFGPNEALIGAIRRLRLGSAEYLRKAPLR